MMELNFIKCMELWHLELIGLQAMMLTLIIDRQIHMNAWSALWKVAFRIPTNQNRGDFDMYWSYSSKIFSRILFFLLLLIFCYLTIMVAVFGF